MMRTGGKIGAGYLACALLMAATVALGYVLAQGLGAPLDRLGLGAIALREGASPPWAIEAARWLTWMGDTERRTIATAAFALWLVWERRFKAALIMAVLPPLGGAVSSLLKEAFARPRPSLVPHLDHVTNLSFPSGHAAAGSVLLLAAWIIPSRYLGAWIGAAVCMMLLIGVSRILLGVHWPSDVIGGWMLGLGVAVAGVSITHSLEGRR
jgi:undecaprenyl-diphosphatase